MESTISSQPISYPIPNRMNEKSPSDPYALIIEPDAHTREMLVEIMTDLDLAYLTADTSQEAIDHIRKQTPSILILNMTCPDAEVLIQDETRREFPALTRLPIIALSAYASKAADWRGLRGLFPLGDSFHHTKDDLRALIVGAMSGPF